MSRSSKDHNLLQRDYRGRASSALHWISMARYRIHRMKDTPRENFRWSPHTSGLAIVKPKDYDPGEELEAATAYAAWKALQASGHPLRPGDLLEECHQNAPVGKLLIAKYIGFEPADWFVPAPKPDVSTTVNEAVS